MLLLSWPMLVRQAVLSRKPRSARLHRAFGLAAEVLEVRQLLSAAVTAVSPNTAQTSGGTQVNITGSGFMQVSAVMFGSTQCTSFQVTSTSTIVAYAPSHSAGNVDIQVMSM